jgi:hypothetical protein
MMVKKVEAGFLSKAEALRRVSGVKDTEQLALELLADERHKLAFKLEEARAMKGVSPNLTVGFLGSVALGEDLSDMAASVQKVEDKAVEQSGLADPK